MPFANKSSFDFWIATPLRKNEPNSLRRLGELIKATCLRRTKEPLADQLKLPGRVECVEWVEMDAEDRGLYNFFKRRTAEIASGIFQTEARREDRGGGRTLTLINLLRRICDHGEQLLPASARQAWRTRASTSIDWQMMQKDVTSCDACGISEGEAESGNVEFGARSFICPTCVAKEDDNGDGTANTNTNEGLKLQPKIRPSSKVRALLDNLLKEQSSDGAARTPKKRCGAAQTVYFQWRPGG